jgi:Holliday junction DNA helicase RuvB
VEEKEAIEVNDVKPSSLRHIVGQKQVVEIVTTELDAAQIDNRRFDHALMVGPPGCGKTSVSHIISDEMACPFIEVLGQSVKNLAELNALLLSAKEDKTVIFVDEAAELDETLQVAIYMALDQKKIVVSGTKAGGSPITIPLVDFTLLLATTHEADLLQPLRDRMRLVLRFQFYSNQELAELVRQRSIGLRWPVDSEVLPEIARRSRGTPRLALRLLQSCRRVCRSLGESTITIDHFRRACTLEQIDELGLGPTEQQYLRILSNGANRVGVMASILGLPVQTVQNVAESFLLRAGLIVKDDQSRRQLTQLGLDHCKNLSNHRQIPDKDQSK